MSSITRKPAPVNSGPEPAASWPAWTDAYRWEPTGPTDADMAWAAENLNDDATDYDVAGPSDADLDFAAGCALAESSMSAGYAIL